MHAYRTHNCNELRRHDVDTQARISGWIHRKRDHGNLLFIDLRDHYGLTQCVIDAENPLFQQVENLRVESVITVTGKVIKRSDDTVNQHLPTGQVELGIEQLDVQSAAEQVPLQVNSPEDAGENTRLTYRYLDLRREKMHRNIKLRSDVISWLRRTMTDAGFMEMQTPILTASSPEGARDYLVPSRVHKGKFYALPQAPQQFKQLLMVAGFDKYFQVAPCFRDEDSRADRSPGEFYQLDFEMAFATQEDVFAALEPILHGLFTEFSEKTVTDTPFPRIAYDDAMHWYGSDKPDLRNPIKCATVNNVFEGSDFGIFAKAVTAGKTVRAIPAPGAAAKPRSFFDKMNSWAQEQGAPGLGYITFVDGAAKGPIAKFLDEERLQTLQKLTNTKDGDAVFFVCDEKDATCKLQAAARDRIGQQLELIDDGVFKFCWIVDFPMFELDDAGRIDFSHNPFSMPQGGLEALENKDPLTIKAYQYDIVCNGIELSSGAIRNHLPEVMYKAFEIAGYTKDQVEEAFGGMLNAFKFGAPPHGGSAPGIDRMVMMLANEPNIREVIAFPLNQQAQDLMMNAPAEVDQRHLKELGLKVVKEIKVEKAA